MWHKVYIWFCNFPPDIFTCVPYNKTKRSIFYVDFIPDLHVTQNLCGVDVHDITVTAVEVFRVGSESHLVSFLKLQFLS